MGRNWLNDAVVYEIYPQSFYDTNDVSILVAEQQLS